MLVRSLTAAAAVAAALAPAVRADTGLFVGFSDDLPKDVGSAAVEPARALGAKAFRITLQWEPGRTSLTAADATKLDRAIAAAGSSVRIVLSVYAHSGSHAPQDDAARDAYCTYVRSALARSPALVDAVIWNEPNLYLFWQPQFDAAGASAAPSAYAALLARCYDVLHAFRPNVNVVAPATSPRGNDRPNAVSNISHSPAFFIQKMGEAYRASGRQRRIFDTFAHHAYGSQPGERPWRTHGTTQISQGDHHKLMGILNAAFGGTGQAVPGEFRPGGCVWIWYAEFGYQTEPDESKRALYMGEENFNPIPDFAGGEPDASPTATTAPDQWTQIIDGIRLAYCQPYVQGVFNFKLVDHGHLDGWQSGFLWADWTQKDSYPAFRQAIAETRSRAVDCGRLKGGPVPGLDLTAPERPRLPVPTVRSRRVRLDWTDSPGADVMGYRVYRAPARGGPFRLLTPQVVFDSAYVDRPVRNGRRYCYVVTAIDSSENQSPRSRVRCAVPRRR